VGMAAGNVMVHTATFFYWWVLLALLGWPWPSRFGAEEHLAQSAAPTATSANGSLYSSGNGRSNGYANGHVANDNGVNPQWTDARRYEFSEDYSGEHIGEYVKEWRNEYANEYPNEYSIEELNPPANLDKNELEN
jgi:hypothetical protein